MKCGCGHNFTWEDFIGLEDFRISFHCPKCEVTTYINLKNGKRNWQGGEWLAPIDLSKRQHRVVRTLEEEIWSFIKGTKISWKGLLGERIGRNYLQQNGYKIYQCHCAYNLLYDLEKWRYVHEKLDPEDTVRGYWENHHGARRTAYVGGEDGGPKKVVFPYDYGLNYLVDDIAFKGDDVYAVDYKSGKNKPTWYKPNTQKKRFIRLTQFGFKLLIVHIPITVDYSYSEERLNVGFSFGDVSLIHYPSKEENEE